MPDRSLRINAVCKGVRACYTHCPNTCIHIPSVTHNVVLRHDKLIISLVTGSRLAMRTTPHVAFNASSHWCLLPVATSYRFLWVNSRSMLSMTRKATARKFSTIPQYNVNSCQYVALRKDAKHANLSSWGENNDDDDGVDDDDDDDDGGEDDDDDDDDGVDAVSSISQLNLFPICSISLIKARPPRLQHLRHQSLG